MKGYKASLLVWIAALCSAGAEPLDSVFERAKLWETPGAEFTQSFTGFEWVSNSHEALSNTQPNLSIFSLPITQALARFENEKLKGLEFDFYTRGDAGEISKEKFQELLGKAREALSRHTGQKPNALRKDPRSAAKADVITWQTPAAYYELVYSSVREVKSRNIPFRAEFIRLQVTAPAVSGLGGAQKKSFSPSAHVKKMPTGDVWIEGVPMVNQGQKGYCVVASVERVLRYFGGDIDSNELAQVGNSTAAAGTSVGEMFDSLKKMGNRLRIRVRTLEQMDGRAVEELVNDYNRLAKREKFPPVSLQGQVIDITSLFSQMRPELIVRLQNKSEAGSKKLLRSVQSEIDKGYPLLWSVMLGIVPEKSLNQTGVGGHMRLIIGYNANTSELLYSDSWGAGHELKRLGLAEGCAITTGLFSIEPLSGF